MTTPERDDRSEEGSGSQSADQGGSAGETEGVAVESDESTRPKAGGRRDPPTATRVDRPEDGDPDELVLFLRDIATSVGAVLLVGLYIFMISGVWPPMVAIESGSMEPNMSENDLVFVMETDRFQPEAAHGSTGVVTAHEAREIGYEQFNKNGDVIVYKPQGSESLTPIIHRVMFWVEDGENWCDRANTAFISDTEQCNEAPHAGFITKGDRNPTYDQAGNGNLEPVKPEWVVGTAEVRMPGVGWLRLQF